MTEEDVRESLEASMKDGHGSVAEIRLVRDRETGSSRGFGYVDFVNKDIAEEAVKELNGMNLGGRFIKLDLDGPKKRTRTQAAYGTRRGPYDDDNKGGQRSPTRFGDNTNSNTNSNSNRGGSRQYDDRGDKPRRKYDDEKPRRSPPPVRW